MVRTERFYLNSEFELMKEILDFFEVAYTTGEDKSGSITAFTIDYKCKDDTYTAMCWAYKVKSNNGRKFF